MEGYASELGIKEDNEVSFPGYTNSPSSESSSPTQSPTKKASIAARSLLKTALDKLSPANGQRCRVEGESQSMPELEPGETEEEGETNEQPIEAKLGWELLRNALSGGVQHNENSTVGQTDRRDSFILMNAMEGGMAREVTEEFMQPLPKSKRLWRFHVVRNKGDYRLFADHDGCFLLRATVSRENRRIEFFLYNPADQEVTAKQSSRPAFTMGFNESSTEWRLVQEKCERCLYAPPHLSCSNQGKQQVAHIRQSKEAVDDGVWNCMDINIPGLFSDNRRVIWCPRLGFGDLGAEPGPDHTAHTLTTMKPQWNEEVESLVLDFMDREIVASAKNFQLALRQKPRYVVCQYGKIGNSTFALDCRYPISLIQAFACAMTTISWT